MRILFVGDPHVRVSNLDESSRLFQFVLGQVEEHKPDRLVLLGDLNHNHAVIRVEVQAFWELWLQSLASTLPTNVLVGNHDQIGSYGAQENSLSIFKHLNLPALKIVDKGCIEGDFAFMPYVHHEEEFIAEAHKLLGAKVLVCHQTFNGSKYENGMFAPDGFDPEKLQFDTIISGHIHAKQAFGKVIYPGTATWQTAGDANQEKGLWLADFDGGKLVSQKYLDTSKVVSPIYEISWKEGTEMPQIPEGRVTIELIGSSAWISQEKAKLKGKAAFKSKITDRTQAKARTSGKSFEDFVQTIFSSPLKKERLMEMIKEMRLGEQ